MDLVPDISLNVIVNVFLLSTMHQIVGPNKSVLKKKLFYFLKTLFTQCCLRPMIASKVIVQFGNRSSGWFSYPNIIFICLVYTWNQLYYQWLCRSEWGFPKNVSMLYNHGTYDWKRENNTVVNDVLYGRRLYINESIL